MKKLYVIGDSISIQYGPYLQQALQGVMHYARKEGETEALLNLDNPQGANGGDSSMVLAFLQGVQRQGGLDADLLLVNCGLHDIKTNPQTGQKQVPIDHYAANLRAIVDLVATMQPTLVWIRTTPCDERIHNQPHMAFHRFAADGDAYNQVADEMMHNAGVPTIDLYTFTRNLGPDLYCDHVHFHESVRAQQAALIAGWLMHWLQDQNT
ncbi:MAG: SGNH/GDSL hydrolase family protein [Caldilineaceae bacterium]